MRVEPVDKNFGSLYSVQYTLIFIAFLLDVALGTEGLLWMIIALGLALPEWTVGSRRLHDIGKTGWSQLLVIIPFAVILIIIWWAKDGDEHDNMYGEVPQ